jgi:signal peptidase I
LFTGHGRKYTFYRDERTTGHRVWKFVRILLLIVIGYLLVTHLIVQSYGIRTDSMSPAFAPGERVLASSLAYGAFLPFTDSRLPALGEVRRGDVVVAELPFSKEFHPAVEAADSLVRFFTLQQQRIPADRRSQLGRRTVRRVIAVPGDTVRMEDSVLYVKPEGEAAFVSEFELAPTRYQVQRVTLPDEWQRGDPFSGNMPRITLSEDQYFIAADNREEALDSRHFGPVSRDRLFEKVLFRFWPLARFGVPGS